MTVTISRVPVSSSNIASIGFLNGTLEVEFKRGGVYRYYEVPQSVHDGLMAASSKGGYFHDHVKTRGYRCEKLR